MSGSSSPAPGHVYEMNFGDFAFLFDYDPNGKEVTFTEAPSAKPMGVPKETIATPPCRCGPTSSWSSGQRPTE